MKAYRYHPRPEITSVKPALGSLTGGDHIFIRGKHLGKGDISRVYFGQRKARFLRSCVDGNHNPNPNPNPKARVLRSSEDGTEVLVET